ncbi:ABC transporter ATP-binding protein [Reyranella sp.]|uniref:ABC transporter ATP-binding protein n=1 Tax=Reyranella sp. TaxID=1929291 RepID=UPI003BAD0528
MTASSGTMPDVRIRGVVKRFGRFEAVAGIDLDVERGQFVTLLGPSGCGKTTTLRMIGGFEQPDVGEILVAGEPVSQDETGRHTRMVFQSYALFPHMTVARNVAFGLRMDGVARSEIAARVETMLASLGLADQAAKYPRQLSGGQQQRVALARALVTRPRVLLLDEPLGALDLKMRKRMQGELKALQRDVGITFIYVTHDQEEAMNLSDVIVVMEKGRIAQVGTPEEIYRRPVSAYVADFVGETNLLPGRVVAAGAGGLRVATRIGELSVPGAGGPAGGALTVAVRPEAIMIGPSLDGQARGRGIVQSRSFLGALTRVVIGIDGTTLTADRPGLLAVQPGDAVEFGWRDEDALALPADKSLPGEMQ